MKRKGTIALMLALALVCAQKAMAKVELPHFISDGMVLQQQTDAKLWGTARPRTNVTVTTSWNGKRYTAKSDADGNFSVKVETPAAGKNAYTITFNDGDRTTINNVLIGEVWLCSGQSNMDMRVAGRYGEPVLGSLDAVVTSANPDIRMFTVQQKMDNTPHTDCGGKWEEASSATTPDFSAAAYFFARKVNQVLDIPVGILHTSVGGSRVEAWMSKEAVAPYKSMSEVRDASILYNGMLNPLVGYSIRGLLWYQGEANVDYPDLYTKLFPDMIKDWRNRWGIGNFPIIYAQIAPYKYNHKEGKGANSAYMREAQEKCLSLIPSSDMIVLSDIGNSHTIHPMDKQSVGNRFAYLALERIYGFKGYEAAAPKYKAMTVDGDKVTLTFDNVPRGMTSFRKPLNDFEVAGADSIFYPAKAGFSRDWKSITVSSPKVEHPVAVRYGFTDYFDGSLFSAWGIPASSFRTDNW